MEAVDRSAEVVLKLIVKVTVVVILIVGAGMRAFVTLLLTTLVANLVKNVPITSVAGTTKRAAIKIVATVGSKFKGALGDANVVVKLKIVVNKVLRISKTTRRLTFAFVHMVNGEGRR